MSSSIRASSVVLSCNPLDSLHPPHLPYILKDSQPLLITSINIHPSFNQHLNNSQRAVRRSNMQYCHLISVSPLKQPRRPPQQLSNYMSTSPLRSKINSHLSIPCHMVHIRPSLQQIPYHIHPCLPPHHCKVQRIAPLAPSPQFIFPPLMGSALSKYPGMKPVYPHDSPLYCTGVCRAPDSPFQLQAAARPRTHSLLCRAAEIARHAHRGGTRSQAARSRCIV
ncbi:hypothetical protein BDW75DRAFT_138180 [Aspergillus navahoensis]